MATTAQFATIPRNGAALLGTRDTAAIGTALTAPANVSTILTASTNSTPAGSQVFEVVCIGTGVTAAGIMNLFVYDGSTYHLYDSFTVTAVTTTNVVAPFRLRKQYADLILPTGWSLRASHTCAAGTNDSILKVIAIGADYS